MEQERISCRESGRRGGAANAENHDTPYFQALGKAGGLATRNKYGAEHYRQLGKKGGAVAKARKSDANP